MCETENASNASKAAGILAPLFGMTPQSPDPLAPRELPGSTPRRWLALVLVWFSCVASTFTALALYKAAPSDFGATPRSFPSGSLLRRAHDRPTLIMFVHPRCACSRASLTELGRLLASARVAPEVLVMVRSETDDEGKLSQLPLVAQARALPGVRVAFDHRGLEAERFGAQTSGHTVLYAADGQLRYAGGLTNSRGHEGPSLGQTYLASALAGAGGPAQGPAPDPTIATGTAPVFGCGLIEAGATAREQDTEGSASRE
jgi:hypothetical protein